MTSDVTDASLFLRKLVKKCFQICFKKLNFFVKNTLRFKATELLNSTITQGVQQE